MTPADIPDLKVKIETLERSLSNLDSWMLVMIALVVLGLILEYWHELPAAYRKMQRLRNMGKKYPTAPILVIAGGILLVVGVSGELVVHYCASTKESNLRTANNSIFSILSNEAAQNVLETEALKLQVAAANERAEGEKLERARLEQKVAWRKFSPEQREYLRRMVPRRLGRTTLDFEQGDTEAENFALDVAATLRSATWNVDNPVAMLMMRSCDKPNCIMPPASTGILVAADKADQDIGRTLNGLFNQLGFDSKMSRDYQPDGLLEIRIEHRPEGAQGEAKVYVRSKR